MSDDYNDDLGDLFGGGGGGYPSISFKFERPGTSWEGILLPKTGESTLDAPAYEMVPQTETDGTVKRWDDGRARSQTKINVLTAFRGMEFMSERAKGRFAENEMKDDGARSQYLKGPTKDEKRNDGSSPLEFQRAVRRARVRKPQVGGLVKQTLVRRDEANGKTTNIWAWEYAPPTPESIAKVKAFLEAQDKASASDEGGLFGDEPPF